MHLRLSLRLHICEQSGFEVDVIRIIFGFALLRFAIGLKNSRHFVIQSKVKPKLTLSLPWEKPHFFVK